MLEINMDELTEEFHRRADESKHLLDSMMDVISEGCVPTEDNVDKLILSVDALRENYLSIYRLACEQLTEDELPGEGMPAQVYADALANSISMRYKRLMAGRKGDGILCCRKIYGQRVCTGTGTLSDSGPGIP